MMVTRHLAIFFLCFGCSTLLPTTEAAPAVWSYVGSAVAVGVAAVTGMLIKYNKLAPVYTPEPGSLAGKTILITGANTGLGLESAKRLAAGGANVILTTRSDAKGQAALAQVQDFVQEMTGDQADASYKVLRLDSLGAIQTAVASWDDIPTIDVLMNNAAMFGGSELELSEDGMEVSFQTNHLSYFMLTGLLKNKLSLNARIINISSDGHKTLKGKGLEFDYIWNPSKAKYSFWKSYASSKLANIYFTQELQRRATTSGKEWTVVACHPGIVSTDIWRSDNRFWKTAFDWLLLPVMRSSEQGATTQVWLAAADAKDLVGAGGQYFADRSLQKLDDFAIDRAAAERLWRESEERAGFRYDLLPEHLLQ